jgi:hypothetical protein
MRDPRAYGKSERKAVEHRHLVCGTGGHLACRILTKRETQLPLCRLNDNRVACSSPLLLRLFSRDVPYLPRDRNRLKRIRGGETL